MTELHPFEGPRGLRGFSRITTTYGEIVEVQESSAAVLYSNRMNSLDGPFAWLRVSEDGVQASAHMSVADMKALRKALKQAIHAWDENESE